MTSNKDIFAAMEKFWQQRNPVDIETGLVLSVGTLTAQVAIGGSGSGQPCSFNSDMVVQRGDEVYLARSKRNKLWVILQVVGRSRAGNSVPSRPTPNNVPGSPRWAAINQQNANGKSWSGTTLQDIVSATVTFNGGTPFLIYNGYITPGGSDVQMDIGWGEGADYQVQYRATIKSTTPYTPVNLWDFLGGALYGAHTFTVRAQLGTGSITPTLNCTRFSITEI